MAHATQAKQKVALRRGEELGSGGFSIAYRATERDSGRVVALKKSRVSLRVKRTLLQHEAAVLKLLSGRPSIPEAFAYGRIEHFELLSVQLLDRSLGDVVEEQGPLPLSTVLEVADQMLGTLEHMHSYGLIHRDIKPDNILLRQSGSSQVCLLDYGLACRPQECSTARLDPPPDGSEGPVSVFGTIPYASLHAHQGLDLSFRNDLESLAYTLLLLARADLRGPTMPTTAPFAAVSVYEQKKRYDAKRLMTWAPCLPPEFGKLVDYARSLSFDQVPDYAGWRRRFKQCSDRKGAPPPALRQGGEAPASSPPPPPVKVGQVLLARLLYATTVEGFSIQAGHEKSYVHNPTLSARRLSPPLRPALVVGVSWDSRARLYRFTAVTMMRRSREPAAVPSLPTVPIAGPKSSSSQGALKLTPEWPLDEVYCYAFKYPTTFYCLPEQPLVPPVWTADASSVQRLWDQLSPPRDPLTSYRDVKSSDPDIRHNARMRTSAVTFYAEVSALTPAQVDGTRGGGADAAVNWSSERGWFDECVETARLRDWDDGRWWTGAPFPGPGDAGGDNVDRELSDSYWGTDYEDWERQQERDRSLTLAMSGQGEMDKISAGHVLEDLDEIVALE